MLTPVFGRSQNLPSILEELIYMLCGPKHGSSCFAVSGASKSLQVRQADRAATQGPAGKNSYKASKRSSPDCQRCTWLHAYSHGDVDRPGFSKQVW